MVKLEKIDLTVPATARETEPIGPQPEHAELVPPPTTQVPVEQTRATHGQKSANAIVKRTALSWREQLDDEATRRMLTAFVEKQRWFGGKARELTNVGISALEPLPAPKGQQMFLATVRAEYAEGDPEPYVMVLSAAKGSRAGKIAREHPDAVIGTIKDGRTQAVLYDAMRTEDGARSLASLIQDSASSGEIVGSPTRAWKAIDPAKAKFVVGSAEQSNTSVKIGEEYMIKLLRRRSEGLNPDLEVGRFLTEATEFERVPNVTGAIELKDGSTVAMVVSLVPRAKDAWEFTLGAIGEYLGAVKAGRPEDAAGALRSSEQLAATLGKRTGELHLALRSEAAEKDPAFAPEPLAQADLRALAERMRGNLSRVLEVLDAKRASLAPEIRTQAERLLAGQQELLTKIEAITAEVPEGAIKTRVHGDYHLGQVLVDQTGKDFFIIDFEGEPTRPLAERRSKQAPEKDVAGMLRSYDYAGRAGLGEDADPAQQAAARRWAQANQRAYLEGYLEAVGAQGASPLLEAYILDKAIYELDYELNNRKAWAGIPMGALLASLS